MIVPASSRLLLVGSTSTPAIHGLLWLRSSENVCVPLPESSHDWPALTDLKIFPRQTAYRIFSSFGSSVIS